MGKKVTFPSGAREKTLRGATQHYLLGGTRLRVTGPSFCTKRCESLHHSFGL
jgi:hypothetical protein